MGPHGYLVYRYQQVGVEEDDGVVVVDLVGELA